MTNELVVSNPGCFVRAEGRAQGARGSRDCIRARFHGQIISLRTLSNSLAELSEAEYQRFRSLVIEAKRMAPHDNPPTPQDAAATGPHLAQGALFDATHTHRHIKAAMQRPGDKASVEFNLGHAEHHADGALSHLDRFIDWCKLIVKGFAVEWHKITAHLTAPTNGNPLKGEKPSEAASSSDPLGTARRRRSIRQIRAGEPSREIGFVNGLSDIGVRLTPQVMREMVALGQANSGVEVGFQGFGSRASAAIGPVLVTAITEPGPGALCTRTSYLPDVAHDTAEEARMLRERGLVKICDGHTHWQGSTSDGLLDSPSPSDLRWWSEARTLVGAMSYGGLIIILRAFENGHPPELRAFIVCDSVTGLSDVAQRAPLHLVA